MGEYSKLIYTDKGIFADGTVSPEEPEFYGLNRMIAKQSRIKQDAYSYYVIQEDGVSILIFRGTANAKNVLSDIDIRTFYDEVPVLLFSSKQLHLVWLRMISETSLLPLM